MGCASQGRMGSLPPRAHLHCPILEPVMPGCQDLQESPVFHLLSHLDASVLPEAPTTGAICNVHGINLICLLERLAALAEMSPPATDFQISEPSRHQATGWVGAGLRAAGTCPSHQPPAGQFRSGANHSLAHLRSVPALGGSLPACHPLSTSLMCWRLQMEAVTDGSRGRDMVWHPWEQLSSGMSLAESWCI